MQGHPIASKTFRRLTWINRSFRSYDTILTGSRRPGGAMAEYILYCLDGTKLVRCEHFKAESDEAAIAESRRLQGNSVAELWRGARRVTVFAPIGAK